MAYGFYLLNVNVMHIFNKGLKVYAHFKHRTNFSVNNEKSYF